MKKIAFVLLAIAIVAMPACKNQKPKDDQNTQKQEISEAEKLIRAELEVNIENLVQDAKKIKNAPFAATAADGSVILTDQEKMVKPDYLLSPSLTNDLVTLSQKYRAMAMLSVDKMIAGLYDMPVTDYDAAMAKLAIDINDDAVKQYAADAWKAEDEKTNEAVAAFVDAEYEAGREQFFWEAITSALVEQVYILTQNTEKFMPMFTDQDATDITFDFICVHEGIRKMVEINPEMESLNKALEPLYVINAITVDQLKEQLDSLKGDIDVVRNGLLK